ncbi:small GTPase superfamily [Syncephalastrum racemosum]|uniref:GTP-binding protein RHO3 n=1 Tax=Syncephalastrum racemosum TaxID=13706 RepID=A0A1X2HCT6_SYNRA|nr:small GTPase superfamily [Syncephalastrum racemosum]
MRFCGSSDIPVSRKLVVCGDGACGKTSLLNVFTRGYFPQVYEPTVFENYVQEVMVDGQEVELSLWDTAGQEEFDRLRSLSYADSHVVVICFSVDSRDSLENIPSRWMAEVSEHCPEAKVVLVALKCDLRDNEEFLKRKNISPVLYEEGLAVAKSINAVRYLECSAKHNRGVRECFDQAARVSLSVKLKTPANTKSKSCTIM